MRVPGVPRFRRDVSETHARRRIGNVNEMLAGRTLNLPARKMGFALQRLIAVRTIEFKFVRAHRLPFHPTLPGHKNTQKIWLFTLVLMRMRM